MARSPIGPYPNIRLSHHLGSTRTADLVTHRYRLTPIPIARPEAGSTTELVVCGSCERTVYCTVFNARKARMWRRLWLTTMATGFAILALLLVNILVSGDEPIPDGDPAVLLIYLGLPAGLVLSLVGSLLWWNEDGVRGPGRFFANPHGLQLPQRRR
jgi:hypothetical protein